MRSYKKLGAICGKEEGCKKKIEETNQKAGEEKTCQKAVAWISPILS
jgi:hypothetical protein